MAVAEQQAQVPKPEGETREVKGVLAAAPDPETAPPAIVDQVAELLNLSTEDAHHLVADIRRLYEERLTTRFSETRVNERLKRTNPFLLQVRGIDTVHEWAKRQIASAVFASEEEAVGHMLEAVAKACHPGARPPKYPDFDYEVEDEKTGIVDGYQVKLSWDCMPMSSRKNLSATIRRQKKEHQDNGKQFRGHFAPCYGKVKTTEPDGQDYISLSSREFWSRVGNGDPDFDMKVSAATALVCQEFRQELAETLVPKLVAELAEAAMERIGNPDGSIETSRLFRAINK